MVPARSSRSTKPPFHCTISRQILTLSDTSTGREQAIASATAMPKYGWRNFLLRLFGAQVGQNVLLRPTVRITYPWQLRIGDNVWVGDFVELYNLGHIEIGADAVVSQNSYICTGSHDYSTPSFDIYAKPIVIEPEAWVAADVFVGPGVRVGRGAVVGARSTLLTDAPEMMVMAGSPARVIRPRA